MNERVKSYHGIPVNGPQWLKWEKDYARRKAIEAVLYHGAEECLSHTTEIVSTDIEQSKYTDICVFALHNGSIQSNDCLSGS